MVVARGENVKILPSNALVVVVSPLNALISDQLESCQRLKLKAVKMEQELFHNDDKLTELEEAEVVYCRNCCERITLCSRLVSLISVCPYLMS